MGKASPLPDHLRCRRNDGRHWRCVRRVLKNKRFCELHYLQARCRQSKQIVPNCIKLQRRSCLTSDSLSSSSAVTDKAKVNKEDLLLELFSFVLQRKIAKTKKRQNSQTDSSTQGILVRDLPNGLMSIAGGSRDSSGDAALSPSTTSRLRGELLFRRLIRSKNVEAASPDEYPVISGRHYKVNVIPAGNCHQCGMGISTPVTCSNYGNEIFSKNCRKKWNCGMSQDVRILCPLCRGQCKCLRRKPVDTGYEDFKSHRANIEQILDAHYLICLLLPIIKQLNTEQRIELEIEAKTRGVAPSDHNPQQINCGYDEKLYCDSCMAFIVDFHRSCSECDFDLCLSCCQGVRAGNFSGCIDAAKSPSYSKDGSDFPRAIAFSKICHMSTSEQLSVFHEWSSRTVDGIISCPPKELGGCGAGFLQLQSIFPFNWTQQLEICAEEIACSYDLPDALDVPSLCSFCLETNGKDGGIAENLREAATRSNSNDNFLYCPAVDDIWGRSIEHFQKHWIRGEPVIARNVLQNTKDLSWDPLIIYQSLRSGTISQSGVETVRAIDCLDWCEVEIGIQNFLEGYLEGRTHGNLWPEMLKLMDWPPSSLFQKLLSRHYDELLRSLPFQEYTNPVSGLFNLPVKLPNEFLKPEMGPHICLSYGIADELGRGDSVTKLHFEVCDVINILVHTKEVVLSQKQLDKIGSLKKKYLAEDERVLLKKSFTERRTGDRTEQVSFLAEDSMRDHLLVKNHSKFEEYYTDITYDRILNVEECKPGVQHDHCRTLYCKHSVGENPNKEDCRSGVGCAMSKSCGVQWDVFRREDVPKLEAYLKEHFTEFRDTHCFPVTGAAYPIYDQSFFLDTIHKRKLKEEFKVEPWTFFQNLGEAIIIPAGCPYQHRNLKSCTKIELDFVSPESAGACIQLIDRLRSLPSSHNAKEDKIEIKKLVLYGIYGAVQEIQELAACNM